jgi:hypothetical protein
VSTSRSLPFYCDALTQTDSPRRFATRVRSSLVTAKPPSACPMCASPWLCGIFSMLGAQHAQRAQVRGFADADFSPWACRGLEGRRELRTHLSIANSDCAGQIIAAFAATSSGGGQACPSFIEEGRSAIVPFRPARFEQREDRGAPAGAGIPKQVCIEDLFERGEAGSANCASALAAARHSPLATVVRASSIERPHRRIDRVWLNHG